MPQKNIALPLQQTLLLAAAALSKSMSDHRTLRNTVQVALGHSATRPLVTGRLSPSLSSCFTSDCFTLKGLMDSHLSSPFFLQGLTDSERARRRSARLFSWRWAPMDSKWGPMVFTRMGVLSCSPCSIVLERQDGWAKGCSLGWAKASASERGQAVDGRMGCITQASWWMHRGLRFHAWRLRITMGFGVCTDVMLLIAIENCSSTARLSSNVASAHSSTSAAVKLNFQASAFFSNCFFLISSPSWLQRIFFYWQCSCLARQRWSCMARQGWSCWPNQWSW